MSLEQAKGETVDARSDVYSLGCMTFEMLTGERPFADTRFEPPVRRDEEPPPVPSARCPDLTTALDAVLARALAPRVEDRFQSTTAMAEALGAAAAPAPVADVPRRPHRAWRRPWIAAMAVAAISATVVAVEALRRASLAPTTTATAAGTQSPGQPDAAPVPVAGPSLAVLPFENVGPAEDAYFAQGVSDELASRLTGVAGVRVISVNSTRQYRNTTKPRTQIGRELGVDYLLAGRVRWDQTDSAAHRVRVTVELVRSGDGSSVWADRYDAGTGDLFAMEGAIGEKVAAALEVALDEPERRIIAARPTENFEAYSYFLRGEALRTAEEDAFNASPRAIAMYERAVALDPEFALAFARLAETHSAIYWANTDRTAKRLELMREAAETAVRLDPGLPEGHLALGQYYYRARRDYNRALAEFGIGLQRQPARQELLVARGSVLRRQGRFTEAAAAFARAVELDPRAAPTAHTLAATYGIMRSYADAVRYLERTIALNPRWAGVYADLAISIVMWRGDIVAARRVLREGMALPDAGKIMDRLRFNAAMLVGFTAADSAVLQKLTVDMFRGDTAQFLVWKADWALRHGEPAIGRAYADSARTILERRLTADPGEAGPRMLLAITYAHLGRKADARREGVRAVETLPVSRDPVDGTDLQEDLAYVEMMIGEHDAAIRRLAYLLSIPSDVSVPILRADPMWDPLRGNPRFQRLLATPTQ